jgi:hypothetical protein
LFPAGGSHLSGSKDDTGYGAMPLEVGVMVGQYFGFRWTALVFIYSNHWAKHELHLGARSPDAFALFTNVYKILAWPPMGL